MMGRANKRPLVTSILIAALGLPLVWLGGQLRRRRKQGKYILSPGSSTDVMESLKARPLRGTDLPHNARLLRVQ